jgi:phosphoserine phosphatase
MVSEIVMGIDRGGKPALPSTALEKEAAREDRATDLRSGREPLERFRAGEISLDAYLDLKVEEATRHLVGLPVTQLDQVRTALRKQIAETPELEELVRAIATSKREVV